MRALRKQLETNDDVLSYAHHSLYAHYTVQPPTTTVLPIAQGHRNKKYRGSLSYTDLGPKKPRYAKVALEAL